MSLNEQAAVFKERAERAEEIASKLFQMYDELTNAILSDSIAMTNTSIGSYRSFLIKEYCGKRNKQYLLDRAEIAIQVSKADRNESGQDG